MASVKREARFLYIYECSNSLLVAIILRSQSRIEALFIGKSLDTIVQCIKASSFSEELRAAWPATVARELGLRVLSPREYAPMCLTCIESLLERLCREDALTLAGNAEQHCR
ncbi:hypothetical protein PABY_02700 [Pyrodictium abyssi]|uniref:Uncharacterized protein n=1 Tax=Pyrodictium abyssi TaxID=54256 RepID=A0ABN6ZKB6_9CREN|nr:hypothetical protein PABY_02700 [Pyrodictium abyssi]